MAESTQDKIMSGIAEKGVTAYATNKAEQNARVFLGVFGRMIADLIEQVGLLVTDCIIQHTTVGELDATVPEALRMKFKTRLVKSTESGKGLTHRIVFTDKLMGMNPTKEQREQREWELFEEAGGKDTDQRIYEVDPYKFARNKFAVKIDADQIIMRSMGMDRQQKALAFQMLTDPRVLPFTDPKAVVDKLVIEEYSEGNPDEFKAKGNQQDMLNQIMGVAQQAQDNMRGNGVVAPTQLPTIA
jgi:hypothetical protein